MGEPAPTKLQSRLGTFLVHESTLGIKLPTKDNRAGTHLPFERLGQVTLWIRGPHRGEVRRSLGERGGCFRIPPPAPVGGGPRWVAAHHLPVITARPSRIEPPQACATTGTVAIVVQLGRRHSAGSPCPAHQAERPIEGSALRRNRSAGCSCEPLRRRQVWNLLDVLLPVTVRGVHQTPRRTSADAPDFLPRHRRPRGETTRKSFAPRWQGRDRFVERPS